MGLAAENRVFNAAPFAIQYPRLRNACDLDGIEALGNPWRQAEALTPRELAALLRPLMSEAHDLESAQRLVALHRYWGDSVMLGAACNPLATVKRRQGALRVGLLSAYLCDHPVGRHLLPLLRHHHREAVEFAAFCPVAQPNDAVQGEIRESVASFNIVGANPHDAAVRIRDARIDVLLELDGHTKSSLIEALAYRPAPVQAEWLGYQFTTGLAAIDYFLFDARVMPRLQGLLCETPVVVPDSGVCFSGDERAIIDPEPPAARKGSSKGAVTFGTLAHPFKYSRHGFALWAGVLAAMPDSRFLMIRPEAGDPAFRANVRRAFEQEGIKPDRVDFFDSRAAGRGHYDCYNDIDIALDTWPVTEGQTTCDALWMGVPTVSLAGDAPHHRLGLGILGAAGFGEFCASFPDEFAAIAATLAADTGRLAQLRRELRPALKQSSLGTGARFAENFTGVVTGLARRHGLR